MKVLKAISLGLGLGIPVFMSISCGTRCNTEYTRHLATRATISALRTATAVYRIDTGEYPDQEQGLAVLIQSPGITNWQGPYIDGGEIPADAWGRPYMYSLSNGIPVISSAGADGQFDTIDDVDNNSRYRTRTTGCSRTR